MTALLIGTFAISGLHTLLWFPRAFQMRRELREAEARAAADEHGNDEESEEGKNGGK